MELAAGPILFYPWRGVNETGLADAAFAYLPLGGRQFLSFALAAFAITTLIGWSYFGEKAFAYLWGEKNIGVYKLLYIVMIYIGAVIPLNVVWECTDFINALMIFPNVLSLFLLQDKVKAPAASSGASGLKRPNGRGS